MRSSIFASLAISLALTLLLELLFALMVGVRKTRDLVLVVLVNTLTNPPVVLLHTLFPAVWVTALLELSAVGVEAAIYSKCAQSIRKPLLFSLGINAFSYLTGLLLNHVL